LYPNSVQSELYVDYDATAAPTLVSIFDLTGRQLYNGEFMQQAGVQTVVVPASGLPAGFMLSK